MRVKKGRAASDQRGKGSSGNEELTEEGKRASRYRTTKLVFMRDILERENIEPTIHTHISNFAPTGEETAFYDEVVNKTYGIWLINIRDKLGSPIPDILNHLAGNN